MYRTKIDCQLLFVSNILCDCHEEWHTCGAILFKNKQSNTNKQKKLQTCVQIRLRHLVDFIFVFSLFGLRLFASSRSSEHQDEHTTKERT